MTAEGHAEEGMDIPGVNGEPEVLYVSSLAMVVRDADVGRYLQNWLEYCILPWIHHTLTFLVGTKERCKAKKI